MKTITCTTLNHETVEIPVEKFTNRIAAYAIIKNDKNQVVLMKMPLEGPNLALPGGEIEMGETAIQALHREIKEETNLEIKDVKFKTYHESYFYLRTHDLAWHSISLVFTATMKEEIELEAVATEDELEGKPEWFNIDELKKEQCVGTVKDIIDVIKTAQK